MGATKRIDQVLNILKTYQRTRSIKATVKTAGCARNTLRSHLRLAAAHDPDLNVVLGLPDVKEINEAFPEQLADHNARPFKKRADSRLSVFTEQEYPHLKALPAAPFLPKTTVRAKVSLSYHIYLGERGNFYSVPHRYVGKTAEAVYSRDLVEIHVGPNRVATHATTATPPTGGATSRSWTTRLKATRAKY